MKFLIPIVSSLLLVGGCSVKVSTSAKVQTESNMAKLSIAKKIGETNTAGIYVWVDPETDCEWLSTNRTSLVPRLDNTGKQICK